MNEGPNFRMPEIDDGQPPPTMTMRRLSETLHRDPGDTDTVNPYIDGGAAGAILELERQAAELRLDRAREHELATEPVEGGEQESQRLLLQSMLLDDPALVLDMIIEFMKSKS